ncbi:conjugal transfer protein TraH [Caminibacter sp.]
MKKRVLSAVLATSLFLTQAQAVSLKDMFNTNASSPIGASINGTHYYFGGNYELRFKKNTYAFKPWINGAAPRFHTGCNGISISGGFISLLGLDDIKNQLDNASTAFAWGLLMGIKASLPIVSQVFEAIQKWARAIQKLLQNACQMGQALSKKSKFTQGVNNFFQEKFGEEGFPKLKENLDNFSTYADDVNKFIDDNINTGKVKTPLGKLLAGKVKGKTVSLATLYFGKYLPKINDKSRVGATGDLAGLYNKKIGDLSLNVDNSSEFERAVLFHKLAVLCFGELGISKADFQEITQLIDGNGKLNKDKAKGAVLQALTGMFGSKSSLGITDIPAKIDVNNVYRFLMNGAASISDTTNVCDSNGKCRIPDYNLLYIDTQTSSSVGNANGDNSNKSKEPLRAFTLVDSESSSNISLEWKGFYQESLDAIRNLVKSNAGLNSYAFVGEAPANTDTKTFVLKGMGKYINILSLLAKKRGGETDYIYYLEKLLAKRNAQAQTFLFVNNIASYIQALSKDPNMQISPTARAALESYFNRVKSIQEAMEKYITGTIKVDDSIRKMDEMFNEIYKSIKKENMKNVGF